MRPTLEELDRRSDSGASAASGAVAQAGAPPLQAQVRQLSLHSSVLVRLESEDGGLEGSPAATERSVFTGDDASPARGRECGLPAADTAARPRSGRTRFRGLAESCGSSPVDVEGSRLPALKRRSASFSGAKGGASPKGASRELARAKTAAAPSRRHPSEGGSAFPSIGAQR